MRRTPMETAESYWRAECARDIEAVMEHYHEDAEFRPGSQVLRGHAEIRSFYEDSVARFPRLENHIAHHIEVGDEGVFEWEAVLTDVGGTRLELNGVNVVRVNDGKFSSVHAYFDASRYQEPRRD
jgi:ketosteroid isomerase-like protein